jgi:hypothetical protein
MTKRKGGDVAQVAQNAYDATASFGVFMAFLQALGGTLFGTVAIVLGVWLIRMKEAYEGKTTATVTASKCETRNGATTCLINYEYEVNGKKYSQKDYKIQGTYVIGNKLNTVYDLNNPENHKVDYYSFKIVGWIVVAIGISIIVGAWIWFIIARTFKVAAAATGVGTIVDFADGNNN